MKDRRKADVAAEMLDVLYDLALGAERQETQVVAACKLLDRLEGLPVARTAVADTTAHTPKGLRVEFVKPAHQADGD
jgi:hypothetical protein